MKIAKQRDSLWFFPCIHVLQPTLVHLYQASSLLPSSLPIVASASLRLPYLLPYSVHINHIQVLGFLPFPYSSCAQSPLSVWPVSNNITAKKNFLFFPVLEFELRAYTLSHSTSSVVLFCFALLVLCWTLCMLCKCSTSELHLSSHLT
jgi:hypothetical protein